MSSEAKELLFTLKRIVKIDQYPSFRYDLYRYFNLLENLEKQKELVYFIDNASFQMTNVTSDLSYDQIRDRNWRTSQYAGTFQSRKMKHQMRFIDEEARDVAQKLINQTRRLQSNKEMMLSFINYNAVKLQLHIRDIPTIVCAIFLFLSLRNKQNKTNIIFQINFLIKKSQKNKKTGKKEEKEEDMASVVYWGKNDEEGEFQIIKVTGSSKTSGANCMKKTIPQIRTILNKEGISNDEITKKLNLNPQQSKKIQLCKWLQDHLKNQNRWYLD